jgi:glycosyltransferase involved in cell wall biosynthesis
LTTLPLTLSSIVNLNYSALTSNANVTAAVWVVFICALIPALLFSVNMWLFRRPGRPWNKRLLPPISVLIPARNEERSIKAAIEAVLASRGVDLELIVLDDGSTDSTAKIVKKIAEQTPRVRLETAPPLPEGWNGKQHACWVLAGLATRDVFCFLDADVRVGTEAIYRTASELNYVAKKEPERALVSGFPRQVTGTFLEWLLLPLIHFVLLGFLPLAGERWSGSSAFAAGCGQFMMVRRKPYFESGGHSANPRTMHDGLLLPKLFREHGFRTSVYDLSRDAVCRMYRSAGEVWRGLTKNATEGMASPLRLPIFTVLLFVGQVIAFPVALLYNAKHPWAFNLATLGVLLSFLVRCFCAWRYQQLWRSVFLHPLGVLVLLMLQWYALLRKVFRRPIAWKGRKYQAG